MSDTLSRGVPPAWIVLVYGTDGLSLYSFAEEDEINPWLRRMGLTERRGGEGTTANEQIKKPHVHVYRLVDHENWLAK